MKNKILVFATFIFVSITSFASTNTSTDNRYYNDYGDSFTFVERGITFSVFQNGEFDFYINQHNGVNIGYQSKNVNISFNSGYNYDAYVQYDNYGAIIQIEDIPIYYDYYGRVDRIGNINLNYQYGRLASLGGLYVHYNNYGSYSHCSGYINTYNRNYVYHPYHNYFARPIFEYRVVSYKPYRNHYKPNRYVYNRDHSKNKYYNSGNKRTNNNTRQRVATQNVPKRSSDNIARSDRNNTRSYSSNRTTGTTKDSRDRSTNSSTRRNTTETRNSGNSRTNTKSSPEKSVQQKRTVTENRSERVQKKRSTPVNSKRTEISENRSKKVNTRKPATTAKERKPANRENSSNENTRKRRG